MRSLVVGLLVGAALLAAPQSASALPQPTIEFAAGQSFGVDGDPGDGGLSAALAPMWAVGERTRFGVIVFADDIGSQIVPLRDPNDPAVSLGLTEKRHRWAWGGAWRADHDLLRGRRWSAGVDGSLGWWRVEDDVRGQSLAASGAVGLGVGAQLRRTISARHEAGIAVRYQELTSDRHSVYRRVDHYATAAFLWRWMGQPRP